MRQPSPFPVTRDNFSICWAYVDKLRRRGRLKTAVAKIGGFIANLVFLLSLLFIVNGLIYDQYGGSYRSFLDSLPFFSEWWNKISGILLLSGDSLTRKAMKLILSCYGVGVVLFPLLALVIAAVYHPLAHPYTGSSYPEAAELLAKAAREARDCTYKTRLTTSIVGMVITITAAFMLLIAYAMFLQDPEAIVALLTRFPTQDAATNCLLYVLAGYFIIHFFSIILLFLTRPVYRFEFPFDLVVQAEVGALIAAEEINGLEAKDAEAKLIENAAAIREQALDLEKASAYSRAKSMLHSAALCGDVPAMEHYARHCLLAHMDDSARYWLQRCASSGMASPEARSMLLRMKLRLRHKVQYLRPEQAPLSTGQRIWQALKLAVTIIWRLLVFSVFLIGLYALVQYIRSGFDPGAIDWVFFFLK